MQDSWPPPEGEHLEESTAEEIDIPVYDAASIDLPIGAGCSAVVCNVLPNTPSTETVRNLFFLGLVCIYLVSPDVFSDQFHGT